MSGSWAEWRRHLPSGSTQLFGILGDPLQHSLSPSLQTAVLRSLGVDGVYVPVPIGPSQIQSFFALAPSMGFVGVNVTTPFKELAAQQVEPLDRESERTGMVNTVCFHPRSARARARTATGRTATGRTATGRTVTTGKAALPRGCGTDGAGILRWLEVHAPVGAAVGILGFGPTARSLLHRLWWKEPRRSVALVTRRPEDAARALAAWPKCGRGTGRLLGAGAGVFSWDNLPRGVEVWISTLPPSTPVLEAFWSTAAGTLLLDMNYGPSRNTLATTARQRGLVAADGLGPLLEQAALSLSIWLQEDVGSEPFRRALGVSPRRLGPTP